MDKLAQEKELIYRQFCVHDMLFAPGAEDLFNFLKTAEIPMTITISSDIENVDFYFEHMHLGRWFELDKVAYNDATFRGKPHPDVFQVAARKLNLEPQETVLFEDSVAGILSAEAVGVWEYIL